MNNSSPNSTFSNTIQFQNSDRMDANCRQSIRSKYLINLNDYSVAEKVDSGSFGKVFKVKRKDTSQYYAAKVLEYASNEQKKRMINREIGIMMRLQHPTIVTFYGYSLNDFEGDDRVTFIMDLAQKGSLASVLKDVQCGLGDVNYDNTIRQKILIGVAYGMMHLHRNHIIHRDLKPANILLDEFYNPRITDFGVSKIFSEEHSQEQTQSYGTSIYMAPEVIIGDKYNKKADVYSFAILMYQVVTDMIPYPDFHNKKISSYQFNNKVINENMRPEFNVPVKEPLKNLIIKCWSANPDERPTFEEIVEKLALNLEDSVYDVFEDDDEYRYYLENVNVEEILDYYYDISGKNNSNSGIENEKLIKENQMIKEQSQKHDKLIQTLIDENTKIKEELEKTKNELEQMKKQLHKYEDSYSSKQGAHQHQINDIDELPEALQFLNDEIKSSKIAKESDLKEMEVKQTILAGGLNEYNQLIKKTNNKFISPPIVLSFDAKSLLSYSLYNRHSVLITSDGRLQGIGDNSDGRISSNLPKKRITEFTEFTIKDGSGSPLTPISAACCGYNTLYMLKRNSGKGMQLVLCDCGINGGKPVFLYIAHQDPTALFGGSMYAAAITTKGDIVFINRETIKQSLESPIPLFSLPKSEKASSVACCTNSIFVLSTNGLVFESTIKRGSDELNFAEVAELSGKQVTCLSGTNDHCLAVTKEGRVFGRGSNGHGQLGLGKGKSRVLSFTEIVSLNCKIRSAYAGFAHSFFESFDGKVIACGCNSSGELLIDSGAGDDVYEPTETTVAGGSAFCVTGFGLSVIFIGKVPQNSPNMQIL